MTGTRADGGRPPGSARWLAEESGGAGADTRPCVAWVRWDRWWTAGDERVCGACAALAGAWLREDEGPWPPEHGNCRCARETGVWWECVTRAGGSERAGPGGGAGQADEKVRP